MQSRLTRVALGCAKLGGAGYLLSFPLGIISLAAGEATGAGGMATMFIAGSVARAADRRKMSRLQSAARQDLARRQAAAELRPIITVRGGMLTRISPTKVVVHLGSTPSANPELN
jgi:hypothetical protein